MGWIGQFLIWEREVSEVGRLAISGSVAPGFESIKSLYEQNMRNMLEKNTQLCVYYKGERVVDLWATAVGDQSFSADSLVNAFSSGKSLESIAIGSLLSQGLLDYQDRVTEHWPEFGGQGKGETTIADLLRHEGGMASLDRPLNSSDLLSENLKKNKVGKVIETHNQKFRPSGKRREYHAITRGWVLNEVFRRVDEQNRTIGEYVRQELSAPLGADVVIGLEESELVRRSPVSVPGIATWIIESLKPGFLGRKIERNFFQLLTLGLGFIRSARDSSRPSSRAFLVDQNGLVNSFNSREVAMGETPSANTHASARGLARLAAMMADRGSFEGKEFINERAWDDLHDHATEADMGFITARFTQGGVASFSQVGASPSSLDSGLNNGREGFFGWMGLGGSLFQWQPELRIGFGYVPTSLNVLDIVNERGKSYQAEIMKCVAELER